MKDPAFLFYSSDFLSGISDLTMEERGQYITMLCLQHQKGNLSEKTIRLNVGSVSVDVIAKFKKDSEGNFFNERLVLEIEKRNLFTESRRNNGLKGGRPKKETKPKGKPKNNHMDNHMGNVNVNENSNKKEDKIELILPFDSEKFISTWKVLCGSKKWKGKSIEALQASLLKLSENSEKDAIQMMLNSIAGEWQGIFELKNNNNGKQESGINKNQHLRDKIRADFENKVNERFSTTPTE